MSMCRDEHESDLKMIEISVQGILCKEYSTVENWGALSKQQLKTKCITNVVRNYPFGRILRAIGEPEHQLHSARWKRWVTSSRYALKTVRRAQVHAKLDLNLGQ